VKVFTEADRKAAQLSRQKAQQRDIAATQHYKLHWLDENWWLLLAKQRKLRLPAPYRPATPQALQKWAKKLSKTPFREHYGCSPEKLIALNPTTPLRTFVGQMLEP
jgi:hypothetical protein